MTILRPSEHKGYLSFLALILFVILSFGVSFIFEYNAFASNRAEAQALTSRIVALQSANADLKNAYYEAIAAPNLQPLALENNLSLDKHPEYLSVNLWLSDSTR